MGKERSELIQELAGKVCRCDRPKRPRMTFCRGCYFALPASMRQDLYKRFGEGYEDAYEAAVAYLADIETRKAGA